MVKWIKNLFSRDKYKVGQNVDYMTCGGIYEIKVQIKGSIVENGKKRYLVTEEYYVREEDLDYYNENKLY